VFSIFSGQDMVPCPFERDLEDHPYWSFIINEQDRRH